MSTTAQLRYPLIERLITLVVRRCHYLGYSIGFLYPVITITAKVINVISHLNVSLTLLLIPLLFITMVVVFFCDKPITEKLIAKQQNLANYAHGFMYLTITDV